MWGRLMLKKLLSYVFALLIISSVACVKPNYNTVITRESPYVVENSTIGIDNSELSNIQNFLPIYYPSWLQTFEEYCEEFNNSSSPQGIIIVRVDDTQTIYWNDGIGDNGGYGITTVSVIKVLEKNSAEDEYKTFSASKNLTFWEPYTIVPDGTVIFPTYTYQQFVETKIETRNKNPIMKQDKYYLIRFCGSQWSMGEHPFLSLAYRCYMGEEIEFGKGEGILINHKDCPLYGKYKDLWFSPGFLIYEFSEEAYERSKAIVEQYESEGKTREDGSYYLYHSMVVDGWERYGAEFEFDKESGE